MPAALAAALVAVAPALGVTLIGSVTLASVLSYGIFFGGAFLLSKLLAPKQSAQSAQPPSAAPAQIPIRQPLPGRLRSYGVVKVAGAVAFEQVDNGIGKAINGQPASKSLWVLQLFGQGEVDSILEHWLGDDQVLLQTDTFVSPSYGGSINGGGHWGGPQYAYGQMVSIQTLLGSADQTAWPDLQTAFPGDVDASYRWRGVPNALLRFLSPPDLTTAEKLYPYGPPNYRCVHRAAKVYDPRQPAQVADGDPDRPAANGWTFSQNAALVILDFLRHPDGWARPSAAGGRRMAPLAQFNTASWQAFADLCDQTVALEGGGAVPRYIVGGTYDMAAAPPKATLQGLLDACDAEIYRDGDGLICIRGGQWGPEPNPATDSIGEAIIIEHSLKPGADKFSATNRIQAKWTSPKNDYQQVDMDPWLDAANVTLRGEELVTTLDFTWVPNHSQARRLAKIAMGKHNPAWAGTVTTNAQGLLQFGKRLIFISLPELGIDQEFLVTALEPSPTLELVKFTVQSLDAAIYDWDAEAEEGVAPQLGAVAVVNSQVPAPYNVAASIALDPSTGTHRGTVSWQNISFITCYFEAQYKAHADTAWIDLFIVDGALSAETDAATSLTPGVQYDFQVRAVTPAGKASPWVGVTVTAA